MITQSELGWTVDAYDSFVSTTENPVASFVLEAYSFDISNISGKEAVGSMVVFIDGKPRKSEYRKYKIKTVLLPS